MIDVRDLLKADLVIAAYGEADFRTLKARTGFSATGSPLHSQDVIERIACFVVISALSSDGCRRALGVLNDIYRTDSQRQSVYHKASHTSEEVAPRTLEYRAAHTDQHDLVFRLQGLGLTNPRPADLAPFFNDMDKIIEAKDYAEMEAIIQSADPSKLSSAAIVFLLRTTAIFRNHVPSWAKFFTSAKLIAAARNIDQARLFRGL